MFRFINFVSQFSDIEENRFVAVSSRRGTKKINQVIATPIGSVFYHSPLTVSGDKPRQLKPINRFFATGNRPEITIRQTV